jgi:hypothetical protein
MGATKTSFHPNYYKGAPQGLVFHAKVAESKVSNAQGLHSTSF